MRLIKLPIASLLIVALGCQSRKSSDPATSKSTESSQSKLELDAEGFPKCNATSGSPKWSSNMANTAPTGDLSVLARCVAKDIDYSQWDDYFKEYNEKYPDNKITPTPVGKDGRANPIACVYEGRYLKDDVDGRKLKNEKAYIVNGEYEADFAAFNDIVNQPNRDKISLQQFEFTAPVISFTAQLLTFWLNKNAAFITRNKDLYISDSYRTNGLEDKDRKQQAILSKGQTRLMVTEIVINQPRNTIQRKNGEKGYALSFDCKPGKLLIGE